MARSGRGRQGGRRRAARPRRVPDSGPAARLLRRLRRDRPVLGRGRRFGVRGLSEGSPRYAAAAAAIDDANDDDPNRVTVRGATMPLALAHGRLAADWIERLVDEPDEALLLAARAHHLRRWELPRSDYPEGRAGYLRWRRDQKSRHARDVAALLQEAGYEAATIERVQALIRRDGLAAGDPGAQAVEDAACLVFLETQLTEVAGKLEHDHLVDVLRKSARKMSGRGLELAADIPLDPYGRSLLAAALA